MNEIGRVIGGDMDDVQSAKVADPRNYDDIGRYLEECSDIQMESAWEAHEKLTAPNGMSFHEMLAFIEDEDLRAHMIEIKYPYLVNEERRTPQDAKRILTYAARGLLSPAVVRRAMSRQTALSKRPVSAKQFQAGSERHRTELEQALRHRHNPEPVTLGIDEIDALIPGGIAPGEVLHIVGGEGGLKTSLLLHILCNYISTFAP
jgi:hypothetical protein